jgi:hypothetical protein
LLLNTQYIEIYCNLALLECVSKRLNEAINHFLHFWEGGDECIQWLSFAQQTHKHAMYVLSIEIINLEVEKRIFPAKKVVG